MNNSPKDYLTDRVKEEMQTIKKGVRVDLDNIIENLEGYNEADNKMPYEDVLFTQINSYFQAVLVKVEAFLQAVLVKVEAFLTDTIQQSMEVGREEGIKEAEKIMTYDKETATYTIVEEAWILLKARLLKSLSPKL